MSDLGKTYSSRETLICHIMDGRNVYCLNSQGEWVLVGNKAMLKMSIGAILHKYKAGKCRKQMLRR